MGVLLFHYGDIRITLTFRNLYHFEVFAIYDVAANFSLRVFFVFSACTSAGYHLSDSPGRKACGYQYRSLILFLCAPFFKKKIDQVYRNRENDR
jgi:hypothetical protein